MKRLLRHLLPLILIIGSAFGQLSGTGYNASRTFVTTSVAADTGISENSSIGWHQIGWTVTGSPASCTVKLQTSPDNTTWTDLITGTCTTNGQSAISAQTLAAYVRIDVTALSASSSVQVQYLGWAYNPNPGGGGSGTVTSITCGTGATCSPTTITTTGIISASGAARSPSGNGTLTQTTNQVGGTDTATDIATYDGAGNTQDSGTLLSALETHAAAIAAFSGIGSCTSQAVTAVNANAAPTCTSLTSAFLPLSSMGTITGGTWNGSTIGAAYGGTGATSFTAYAPLFGGSTAVQSASSAGTSGEALTSGGSSAIGAYTDLWIPEKIPAANCNNATAGSGWSIGSSGTVTCRAGTNNLGGYIAITDTSSTFAQFSTMVPEDWDTASDPYIRFAFAYPGTDGSSSHTIIPQIKVSCVKGDGSTTDDVTFATAHSSGTTTLSSATANLFFANNSVQLNSTDMSGCVAGSMMVVQVGRATDTATSAANFYFAVLTWPHKTPGTAQAN